jgi:hypothetical protein
MKSELKRKLACVVITIIAGMAGSVCATRLGATDSAIAMVLAVAAFCAFVWCTE